MFVLFWIASKTAQEVPKRPQGPPKTAQEAPKRPQDAPRSAQRGSKKPLTAPQEASREPRETPRAAQEASTRPEDASIVEVAEIDETQRPGPKSMYRRRLDRRNRRDRGSKKTKPQIADIKRRAGGGDPPWGSQSAARPFRRGAARARPNSKICTS